MEQQYKIKVVSALEKVFADQEPPEYPAIPLTALKGETVSFQFAYTSNLTRISYAAVKLESPRREQLRLREVVTVPCRYPAHPERDEHYLRTAPGLYPDLLQEPDDRIRLVPGQWKSLWVDLAVSEEEEAGEVPITLTLMDQEGGELIQAAFTITVLPALLPEQSLIRTEWFHTDCLADYYQVEVFSERHWEIIENFIKTAVSRGINMILTPQFTPPLDTEIGGERTTVQLVDIFVENGTYRFEFGKLQRWVEMCCRCGVSYLEMSHLFTQWGALAAPKIMAMTDCGYRRIFGWDTPAVGGEYTCFLNEYLPRLTAKLKEWGVAERTWFHISDEPEVVQLESYRAARMSVAGHLQDFVIIDALSDYEFYQTGAVSKAACATDHITPFLEHKVPGLWAYYCTAQCVDVSNRFFSMSLGRTRAYGLPLFKYDIQGILHWGYNFYNSQFSIKAVDPYFITDSGEAFPGGDAFLVYPGADGTASESLRMMTMYHMCCDLRAMELLAQLRGRDCVMALMEEGLSQPVTFSQYPQSADYLLAFREGVNREITAASVLSGR